MSCAPCPVAVLNAARSVYAVPAQTYSGAALAGSMRLYAVTLCAVDDASTDAPTPVSGLLQADGCAGALCAVSTMLFSIVTPVEVPATVIPVPQSDTTVLPVTVVPGASVTTTPRCGCAISLPDTSLPLAPAPTSTAAAARPPNIDRLTVTPLDAPVVWTPSDGTRAPSTSSMLIPLDESTAIGPDPSKPRTTTSCTWARSKTGPTTEVVTLPTRTTPSSLRTAWNVTGAPFAPERVIGTASL